MTMLGSVVAALAACAITYWLVRWLTPHVPIPFDEYIARRCAATAASARPTSAPTDGSPRRAPLRIRSALHGQRALKRGTTTLSRGAAYHTIIQIRESASSQARMLN